MVCKKIFITSFIVKFKRSNPFLHRNLYKLKLNMVYVKMKFNIEDRAMTAINNSPESIYHNAESIPIWTKRSNSTKIFLATPETLVDRISKLDLSLIKDIGKQKLIRNLSEHAERVYNKVSRLNSVVNSKELLETLDERLPYIFLQDMCNKPENGTALDPYAVGSFLAYHDNPTNNEKENRKSKIVNDQRHVRRNLEAHLGLHVFRDEEVQALLELADDMIRNEGYPSLNEQGFFRKKKGYIEEPEQIFGLLFKGNYSVDGFNFLRPSQYIDEHDFAQSVEGRSAAFVNRYNRPDVRTTATSARDVRIMINKIKNSGSNLSNGKLFTEAQKRVIAGIIKRDQL